MELQSWRKAMFVGGAILLLVGSTLMVGGGLYAGQHLDSNAMRGIWVASAGTLGVVTGAVMAKLALFGPYPQGQELPEVDD